MDNKPFEQRAVSAYIKREGDGLFALYVGVGLKIPVRRGEYSGIRQAREAAQAMAKTVCIITI